MSARPAVCLTLVLAFAGCDAAQTTDPDVDPGGPAAAAVAWSFDEGRGDVLSAGSGAEADRDGAAWLRTDDGAALVFDGLDDAVRVPALAALDPAFEASGRGHLALWVRLDDVPSPGQGWTVAAVGALRSARLEPHIDLRVEAGADGAADLVGTVGGAEVRAAGAFRPDVWHHVALSVGDGRAALFRNGSLASEAETDAPFTGTDDALWLGAGTAGAFDGVLDDLALGTAPLDAASALALAGDVAARQADTPGVPVLRTPAERFQNLPGYPFEPHFVRVDPFGLRMHYLDEGPADGEVVVLVHGNPAWSYLVRELVPPLVAAGYRVLAPDLVGFGRSDKPSERAPHTYDHHEAWLAAFFETLDLTGVTLHVQDWGGLLGLRIAPRHPERFARVAISNTALPDCSVGNAETFAIWQRASQTLDPIGSFVLGRATPSTPSAAEVAAYDAPWPSVACTLGARELPLVVPFACDDPEAVENQAVMDLWRQWTKPVMTVFSEDDGGPRGDLSFSAGGQAQFRDQVPGAAGQPHVQLPGTGHYLQEDAPLELAQLLIDFITAD